jgi:hypothetical protein
VAAYVRTVKTASGATAVQVVHSSRRGARDIDHLGSAHEDAELEVLKAAARYRLTAARPSSIWVWTSRPPCLLAGGVARCRSRRRGWGIWWMS